MSGSFSNIYLHIVFAVKYRDAVIAAEWSDELHAYIAGVIKNYGHVPIRVGGYRDHVHILLSTGKIIDVPDLVKNIKVASGLWIQSKFMSKFFWQAGYGCFSVSYSHVDAVAQYIARQAEHHSRIAMPDEFRRLFSANGVTAPEKYICTEPE